MLSASAVLIPDNPFNPYELRPLASLNRRRLIALPGVDSAWAGKTGWDLCSTPALIQLIQSRAAELGLDRAPLALAPRDSGAASRESPGGLGQGESGAAPASRESPGGLGQGESGAAPVDLPMRLNDLLASPDQAVRESARAVAKIYGQRLGGLVASILLSPDGLTTPLDPWEAAYLRHWRGEVQQLFLGGGLSNGRLGETIACEAEAMLKECGILQLHVQPASNPSYLPLIGAARRLPAGEERVAVVADFGSTWAKRALAYYRASVPRKRDRASGELEKLLVLPPVRIAPWIGPGKASQLAAEMVAILADTIHQAGPAAHLAQDVVCSLAAYVVDGQPAYQTEEDVGGYYGLHILSNDLCGWFSEQVSRVAGWPLRVCFAHDAGTAAAALAGQEKAAVIMLGSALGVGFVPPMMHP